MADGSGRRDIQTLDDSELMKCYRLDCAVGFPCSFLLHCCSLVCGRFESQPTLLLIGRSDNHKAEPFYPR